MKLNYFELLSPEPVQVPNTGGIISPSLRAVASVGYGTYQYYLTIMMLDLKTYLSMIGCPEKYDLLSDEEKSGINMFELLTASQQTYSLLQNVLNFFIREEVVCSREHNGFLVQDNNRTIGIITKENYPLVCDLICQRNYTGTGKKEDLSKIKNKKALEIAKKLQNGRNAQAKQSKADKNMELGNIISAVANKSHSLNMINIWDLTVYQLWDCFSRISNNNIYDIQSMSVAAWGDKDKHFDPAAWFKRMETDN